MATVTLTLRYLDSLHSKREAPRGVGRVGARPRGARVGLGSKVVSRCIQAPGRRAAPWARALSGRPLEMARKIATQHRGRIFDGADPAGDKQAEQSHDEQTVQALYDLKNGPIRRRRSLVGPTCAAS